MRKRPFELGYIGIRVCHPAKPKNMSIPSRLPNLSYLPTPTDWNRPRIHHAPHTHSSSPRHGMPRLCPGHRHSVQPRRTASSPSSTPRTHTLGHTPRRMLRVHRIVSKFRVLPVQARDRFFRVIVDRQRIHRRMGSFERLASRRGEPVNWSGRHGE
jgi:hypothetical protein